MLFWAIGFSFLVSARALLLLPFLPLLRMGRVLIGPLFLVLSALARLAGLSIGPTLLMLGTLLMGLLLLTLSGFALIVCHSALFLPAGMKLPTWSRFGCLKNGTFGAPRSVRRLTSQCISVSADTSFRRWL